MKNIRISKKLLSMLTAGVLMVTPIAANANSNESEETNNKEFTLVMQEKDYAPLGLVEFAAGVGEAYEYLTQFINYDGMQQDLQCLYYLTNREYIPGDDERELIARGYVFETSIDEQKYENFARAYNLINSIAIYNQKTIRNTSDSSKMIDVSMICYGSHDKSLLHDMHMNYFDAYQNGRYDNEYFQMVFNQLTNLNASKYAGNAAEVSVGARWLALNSIGGGVMQMLRDDMQEDFTRSELNQYFVQSELNQGQWILRKDVSPDLNCLKEGLEVEVFDFGQLWEFVYDDVNNDIQRIFAVDCTKSK